MGKSEIWYYATTTLFKKTGLYSHQYRYEQLKKTFTLKEMYIVRYADDFKICTTQQASNAEKVFLASKMWLEERLSLFIGDWKSLKLRIVKRSVVSFLFGFELQMERRGYDRLKKVKIERLPVLCSGKST